MKSTDIAEKALTEPEELARAHSASALSRIEKRKITRSRTSYSCRRCRLRKVKCDKQHPKCGNCSKTQEHCDYGPEKPESSHAQNRASGAGLVAKRRRSIDTNGLDSPPNSQGSGLEHPQLDVLDLQLNRLSSMIERIRRDTDTSPYRMPGPLTPISREDEQYSTHSPPRIPAQRLENDTDEHPLPTKDLSDLSINKSNGTISAHIESYWASIVEEMEQLNATMQGIRPLAPLPHADATEAGCSGQAYSTSQNQAKSSASEPLSFRSMAKADRADENGSACSICFQNSSDKSMLLPGNPSHRLAALTKLNLTAGVPTEAQSNVLFRAWLSSTYPVLPFMSIQQAFRRHQAFWDWKKTFDDDPVKTSDSADLYSLPLLYSVWYSGALAVSTQGFKSWFPDKTRAEIAAHFHEQLIRYLTLVSFPSNLRVPLLGCFVVIQSLPVSEEEPVQSSTFVNLMIKLAQTLGLHREPSLYGVPQHESEMRRRLWWQIVQLDSNFASASGYSSFIDDSKADTRPVSEVSEAFVGSIEEERYLPDVVSESEQRDVLPEPLSSPASIVSAFALVARGFHKAALAIRKAANMHVSPKPVDKVAIQSINKTINDAEIEIRDTIKRLPTKGVPELGFDPDTAALSGWPLLESEDSFGQPMTEAEYACYFGTLDPPQMPSKLARYHRQKLCAFNKWARISLSAMCDRMYLVTYAPFLRNSKSRVWTSGRQCALHHGMSFLRKLISLATDPSLESFRWNWPGPLQPMHAAMVLLVDVYERPHSDEAPRCRALIDHLFSLADPVNNITGGENGVSTQRPLHEGGSEAWDLLRDLRVSGWRKAGLDPNVLWTDHDQMTVGVAKPQTTDQKMMQSLREDLLEPGDEEQQQTIGSYPGLRYALQAAQEEMKPVNPESTATPSGRHSRQLFKLPTQQAMPYPLLESEERGCPGPSNDSDDTYTEAVEAEVFQATQVKQRPAASTTPAVENASYGPDADQRLGQLNAVDTVPLTAASTSETSHQPNEVSRDSEIVQDEDNAHHEDRMITDGVSEGFDWERWDAVFGQYSGFTDLMEMDTDMWEDH